MDTQEKINSFTSLFKGRTDVFARRWERWGTDVSGYSPAYTDKEKQKYLPLSNYFIEQHFRGNVVLGVYPLLTDNTSWFVVADFDGENWLKAATIFLNKCSEYNLPGYIERSRSGNGGHVWFFFEHPYPAYKSRKIFLHLIKESGGIDQFDKEDSFDRLFPNQDYHSGKGLGNLIALPLQGNSVRLNNSIFLNLEDDKIIEFENQWEFLGTIKRIKPDQLDEILNQITGEKSIFSDKAPNKNLTLTIGSHISIPKRLVSKSLATFLTENLNFFNSDYLIRRNMGLSVYKVEKYFKAITKDDDNILIPRGFVNKLTEYFNDHNINFTLQENLNKPPDVEFDSEFNLFDYQKEVLEYFNQDQGILVAPPGSGKTIMGLAMIAQKSQPALIITHRKQIYNQWLERIEAFLKIPKKNIGQYSVKKEIKSPITVAMIQSLAKAPNLKEISDKFGLVLVDECHHMPARTFRDVITKFSPKYLYGLTATPTRKNNDERLIFVYLGDILHTVPKDYNEQTSTENKNIPNKLQVLIRETDLSLPFNIGVAQFPVLSRVISFDSQRNSFIVEDIIKEAKIGKKCLVLTERKDHADILGQYLKHNFEVSVLTGTLTPSKRREKEKQIADGHFQILIATGQLLGEGTSLKNIDCLFLVYPFSYEGKLIQYIGRIQHGKANIRTIYDYRDKNVEYLEKLFKKRAKYYKTLAPF